MGNAETQGRPREFNVFLCYNSADKKQVHRVAERLQDLGLNTWLDREQLRPGDPVARDIQEQISKSKVAAVFIGGNGLGRWQEMEFLALLEKFVRRGCRVIPVLLPGCPPNPSLPPFLKIHNYVDLRKVDPDPIEQLYWGITGKKLDRTTAKETARRERGLTWCSSIESVAAGDVSALALAEVVIANALFAWLAWRFGVLSLVINVCVAVLFVLRTPRSVSLAWDWYHARFSPRLREQNRHPLMRDRSDRSEWLFMVLVAPVLVSVLALINASEMIVIRAGATAFVFLCHPLETVKEIPGNWLRAVLSVDSLYPLELLPEAYQRYGNGHYDGITEMTLLPGRGIRLQLRNLNDNTERFVSFVTIPILAILFFLPALLYRWYLKGSFLVYWPFMLIFHVSRAETRTLRVHLRDILSRLFYRLGRYLAVLVWLLFIAKTVIYLSWNESASWWWCTLPGRRLLDAFVMPAAFPPWQIAIVISAAIVWPVYVAAEWFDSRLDDGSQVRENIIRPVLHVQAIVQWFLCSYVILCWIYILASLSGLVPSMGTRILPWL